MYTQPDPLPAALVVFVCGAVCALLAAAGTMLIIGQSMGRLVDALTQQ